MTTPTTPPSPTTPPARTTPTGVANPRRTRLHGTHSGDLDAVLVPRPAAPTVR